MDRDEAGRIRGSVDPAPGSIEINLPIGEQGAGDPVSGKKHLPLHSPRLLDLFAGAGGAARGYQMAGFHVTGVDIKPQPRYAGDVFHRADALDYLERHGHEFDAIHCSPPCQHYAPVTRWRGDAADHPDLVPPMLALLARVGRPWVVENVPGAPIRADYLLCGTMFGLRVRRHRLFEVSFSSHLWSPGVCRQAGVLPFAHKGERAFADAMGCSWMTGREAREAIPPAFTHWIGRHLLGVLASSAVAS